MGPGMAGRCHKGNPWYPSPQEGQKKQTASTLIPENAVSMAQDYLSQVRNPNLTLGKTETKQDGDYLVEIVTKDGSLSINWRLITSQTGSIPSTQSKRAD